METLASRLSGRGLPLSPAVVEALKRVPRHLFLPDLPPAEVYRDEAIVLKERDGEAVSSSSQPTMMAIMLDQLGPAPGQRVLEIGTGSGYNAALLAELVGPDGAVVTIDLDEELVARARAQLAAAGRSRVRALVGDGGFGYAEMAPYDGVIVTAAAWDLPSAWLEQLRPGGRLVTPLVLGRGQVCAAFEHTDGGFESRSLVDCSFMRLRGSFEAPAQLVRVGPQPGLLLDAGLPADVPWHTVLRWLEGPFSERPTAVSVRSHELWDLTEWLALRHGDFCALSAARDTPSAVLVPPLPLEPAVRQRRLFTVGLLGDGGLALLCGSPPEQGNGRAAGLPASQLVVRAYGESEEPASRLAERLVAWDRGGRGSGLPRSIGARPRGQLGTLPPGATAEERPSVTLAVTWS